MIEGTPPSTAPTSLNSTCLQGWTPDLETVGEVEKSLPGVMRNTPTGWADELQLHHTGVLAWVRERAEEERTLFSLDILKPLLITFLSQSSNVWQCNSREEELSCLTVESIALRMCGGSSSQGPGIHHIPGRPAEKEMQLEAGPSYKPQGISISNPLPTSLPPKSSTKQQPLGTKQLKRKHADHHSQPQYFPCHRKSFLGLKVEIKPKSNPSWLS